MSLRPATWATPKVKPPRERKGGNNKQKKTVILPPGLTLAELIPSPDGWLADEERATAKKSRATPGRIPRPHNAFMFFRSDFMHQEKVPPAITTQSSDISCFAGYVWSEMSATQQQPWWVLAEEAEKQHALKYPDYKYRPTRPPRTRPRQRSRSPSPSSVRDGGKPSSACYYCSNIERPRQEYTVSHPVHEGIFLTPGPEDISRIDTMHHRSVPRTGLAFDQRKLGASSGYSFLDAARAVLNSPFLPTTPMGALPALRFPPKPRASVLRR